MIKYRKLTKEDFEGKLFELIKKYIGKGYENQIQDQKLELGDKLNYAIHNLVYEGKISEDLDKIEFDFENTDCLETENIGDFYYMPVVAGGDWEHPVFFIIYFDDEDTVRAYIPEDGNVYNIKMKSAFGNHEDEEKYDFVDGKWQDVKVECTDDQAFKEQYRQILKEQHGIDVDGDGCDFEYYDLDFDEEKMVAEITSKLELVN
ncbi:gp354 [Bacillus phage G]|uniref:Gp354 n=1 Tax=Bacillus phage G TaxID=2884420 RepID=G3MA95_9CAUD|nr:gp354 [Bacillus phage G]AEO93613.1 gp354 [Bacillus phage G]